MCSHHARLTRQPAERKEHIPAWLTVLAVLCLAAALFQATGGLAYTWRG